MIKILKYLFFRTILVIISLHAIIPHPHSNELTKEKHVELHKKSNSFIGIIRLVFHESDDEILDDLIFAQFQTIKKSDNKYKYPTLSIVNKIQFIVEKTEKGKKIKWNANNFDRLHFVIRNGLRGPPFLN